MLELDIPYGPGINQVFDFYPSLLDDKPINQNPIAIYAHSGGWKPGSNEGINPDTEPFLSLRESGFNVASVRYPLTPVSNFPHIHKSLGRAIQFIRYAGYGDKLRVLGIGRSAGAGLYMPLCYGEDLQNTLSSDPVEQESSRPQAFVNNIGITDWNLFASSVDLGYYFGKQYANMGAVPQNLKDEASAGWLLTHGGVKIPTLSIYLGAANPPPLKNNQGHDSLFARVLDSYLGSQLHTFSDKGWPPDTIDFMQWVNANV